MNSDAKLILLSVLAVAAMAKTNPVAVVPTPGGQTDDAAQALRVHRDASTQRLPSMAPWGNIARAKADFYIDNAERRCQQILAAKGK